MEKYKKFAFDVGLTAAASTISALLAFGVSIILGRQLGANDLGLYRMVLTIFTIGVLIPALGIPSAIVKFVAEQKADRKRVDSLVSSGLIMATLLGVCASVAFYTAAESFQDIFEMEGLASLLRLISPIFPFALLNGVLLGVLNGLREMKKFAIATILQAVVMLLVSTLVILVSPRIEIAIIGILASQIVSFLYLAWVSKKYFAITFNHYIEYAKNLLSFGSRVLGANAVNLINYHGDLLLVGFFLTSSDVGVYGIAVGLGKFFWLFPQAIQTVTYPTLSEHWKRNETTTVRMIVDKSTKYAALMLVPTGLMIGFYADEVIGLIFGPNFEGAVLPLRILLIGTVANGVMQRPIGSMLFSLGKPGLNLRIFTIGAVVNLSLNLVFIPSIGVSGAAMASSISFALITILVLFYIRRITGITIEAGWFMKLWSLALVCILMEIAVAEMYHASIGVVLVSGVFLLIWFRLLCVDDRRRIREIVKSAVSASFRLR